ncbi:competence protein CoiA family protein [Pseudomonas mosselii]
MGEKRPPKMKGERTRCSGCGGSLTAVMPQFKVAHWRHEGGDCDPWSEPEGEWHRTWKAYFNPIHCEVFMRDPDTQEIHRADVMCPGDKGKGVVLELQHSHISEEERSAREAFYSKENRMFWLLNMHRTRSLEFSFGQCLSLKEDMREEIGGHDFYHMEWIMRGTMLDKWKQSRAHVFLNYDSHVYYLATNAACRSLVSRQAKGQFALAPLTIRRFLTSVAGEDLSALMLPA